MMDSEISSSDSSSECDESILDSVNEVFNSMKQNLSKYSMKIQPDTRKVQTKICPLRNGRNSKRRQIYQTFSDKDEDDSEGETNKELPKQDTSDIGFFIDKGCCRSLAMPENMTENTHKHNDNVISFDLSNLDSVPNETEQSETHKRETTNKKKVKKTKKEKSKDELSTKLKSDLIMDDVYINVDPFHNPKSKKNLSNFIKKHNEPEIMKKSVITADYEKQDSIATTHVSIRQQKKERKIEREKTKGDKWYNLPATEISDERKHDLSVLQMRKALDPKRFYKANDLKVAPKYFQFGKVVEDPTDFYSSRIPKKQRKSTIVEELLADSEFRQYNKRKYEEVQEAKRHGKGPYKHMKRLKKRKR